MNKQQKKVNKLLHDEYLEIEFELRNAGIVSIAEKMTAYSLLTIMKNDKHAHSIDDVIKILKP